MLGELSRAEIEQILLDGLIGRIGCHAYGKTYVVPITYAYDGEYVYAHSGEGMKLHMMRANPHVCFEVDAMDSNGNWRSIVAWGTFEEIHSEPQRKAAMALLVAHIEPRIGGPPGASVHPKSTTAPVVLYRIKLTEKTGRFERRA
jgi:nitroimidazol reductase NimA-like FMN-containing flavoprotein (pyridoxamine 5'-phosphate oxidase superfamily)